MSSQNLHNQEDQLLVGMLLRGDKQAFTKIVKNTERLVAQIVFKMIGNTEDRKDIAQDIYMKVYQNLHRFRFESKLSTWIGQIAYNTCLTWLEKKKIVLVQDFELSNIAADENATVSKKREAIIAASMERLTPIFKTLITLYHNEDMSYAEMVRITGLPEGTIKSYLFRARKALKDDLLLHYKKEEI